MKGAMEGAIEELCALKQELEDKKRQLAAEEDARLEPARRKVRESLPEYIYQWMEHIPSTLRCTTARHEYWGFYSSLDKAKASLQEPGGAPLRRSDWVLVCRTLDQICSDGVTMDAIVDSLDK